MSSSKLSIVTVDNAAEYKNNDFGKVVSFESIKGDMENFAEVFSEGSPALKKLLICFWTRNIETAGCCIRHNNVRYYKDTVFGNSKSIDEKTYLKHTFSKKYHKKGVVQHAYFSFLKASVDNIQKVCEGIEKDLAKSLVDLPFEVYLGKRIVSIVLNKYVDASLCERFFTNLSDALHHNIPSLNQNIPSVSRDLIKPSLEFQIKSSIDKSNNLSVNRKSNSLNNSSPER